MLTLDHIVDGAVYGADAVLRIRCVCCHEEEDLWAPVLGLDAWEEGCPLEQALPEMTITDRDVLETGLCHTCAVVLVK